MLFLRIFIHREKLEDYIILNKNLFVALILILKF